MAAATLSAEDFRKSKGFGPHCRPPAGTPQVAFDQVVVLSRGDRRRTFPNDSASLQLLWRVLPQPFSFAADTFLDLGKV
jgi:hypothetical protein